MTLLDKRIIPIAVLLAFAVIFAGSAHATTKGLSQIVTPDLQSPGDFSLSFQAESIKIGNPYQLQGELGLTKWAEVAVFKGFKPNELIFGTEFGLIQKEPYLLSAGFVNWSPHSHVDPAVPRSRLLVRASQIHRRRHPRRLSQRSDSWLRLRLQQEMARPG